jgi:RNA polymerase sigma-70 factor (ECF subfamily)
MTRDELEGDADRLYDELGPSLYRYAVMLLVRPEAAEDVVQQVFVACLTRGLRGIDDPERYLRRCVRNACYSVLRGWQAAAPGAGELLLETIPAAVPPVSEEMRLALGVAIARLPTEQREVLHLHAFEGRTFRDIAEITSTPLNTVASRYRYALERLRVELVDLE